MCLDCGYKFTDNPYDLTRDQILFLTAALARRIEQMRPSRLPPEGVTRIVATEDEEA